jgi:hypothetical protein
MMTLTTLVRAEECGRLRRTLSAMRSVNTAVSVREHLNFRQLAPADAVEFADATFIVATNNERAQFNKAAALRAAATRGLPVVTWDLEVTAARSLPHNLLPIVRTVHPVLCAVYVRGAPAVLTQNMNTSIGLCNGTRGTVPLATWCSLPTSARRRSACLLPQHLDPLCTFPFRPMLLCSPRQLRHPHMSACAAAATPPAGRHPWY